jgi:hypothetical protein
LEVADPAEAVSYWRFLGDLGYEIMWCPGPSASSSCALVAEGYCPLVERADIVLTALKPDDDYARPVPEQFDDQNPVQPTIVVAPVTSAKRRGALFERSTVLDPYQLRRELPSALALAGAHAVRRSSGSRPAPSSDQLQSGG